MSVATLPRMADRTITIGGYSKTLRITGWRIGYSVAAARWAQAIGAMNDLLYVCAPTPLQAGVAVGIQELPDCSSTATWRVTINNNEIGSARPCRRLV